jgi:transposase-like protein
MVRRPIEDRIRIVTDSAQTYVAWSRRCMMEVMIARVDKILNNIL